MQNIHATSHKGVNLKSKGNSLTLHHHQVQVTVLIFKSDSQKPAQPLFQTPDLNKLNLPVHS